MTEAAKPLALRAQVTRASALWWAAAYVGSCLLALTVEPVKDLPTDLVGCAGGSAVGLAWSWLAARALERRRRRLNREPLGAGLALAVLGGCVSGMVASVADSAVQTALNLHVWPMLVGFSTYIQYYISLFIAWEFIYFTIMSADRVARVDEYVHRLRLFAIGAHNSAIISEFRPNVLRAEFGRLSAELTRRDQARAREIVMALADRIRFAVEALVEGNLISGDFAALEVFSVPQIIRSEARLPGGGRGASRDFSVATYCLWAGTFFIFLSFGFYFQNFINLHGLVYSVLHLVSMCIAGVIICCTMEKIFDKFFLGVNGVTRWTVAGTVSVMAAYLNGIFPAEINALFRGGLVPNYDALMTSALYCFFIYVAWFCMYYYAQALRRESAQRALLAQTAEAAAAARNSMLRYQVRPHFLFNALNALYTLVIDARWTQAREMTDALSAYVDRSFTDDERDFVPVSEQAAALGAYLSIETVRFGERLRVKTDIEGEVAQALAPALILHPLVENAMKYAVATSTDPVDIELRARREGEDLVLTVADSGGDPEALHSPGLGIGLGNVRARLAGHYGERGVLQCKRLTPKGFVAEIRLPLELVCKPSAVSSSSTTNRSASAAWRSGWPNAPASP